MASVNLITILPRTPLNLFFIQCGIIIGALKFIYDCSIKLLIIFLLYVNTQNYYKIWKYLYLWNLYEKKDYPIFGINSASITLLIGVIALVAFLIPFNNKKIKSSVRTISLPLAFVFLPSSKLC